jgi:hypothetical protein
MKKLAIFGLALAALSFAASPFLLAEGNNDLQVIKKAVRHNPAYEAGKEVRWLKILVTENGTKEVKVKVTLPLSVLDIFFDCTKGKRIKVHDGDCEIDLRALFKELKARGPMALIEINEADTTFKIWFE